MWEFYLAGAEMALRYDKQAVFQIQLVKNVDSLPLTRNYMFEAETNKQLKTAYRSHAA
jgi:cyclopropane-fatty-acyl-phospholipid synthase